ncbi:MAG: hypothetical protein Q4D81_07355 [Eubacteriales bacterium]|nr:hypothetical protein [Eubacteriales bacterium]
MKECRIITINDGREKELANGNWLHIEEFPRMAEIIGKYLQEGWEVVHFVPVYNPAVHEEGKFSFYRGGYTFYLEREAVE